MPSQHWNDGGGQPLISAGRRGTFLKSRSSEILYLSGKIPPEANGNSCLHQDHSQQVHPGTPRLRSMELDLKSETPRISPTIQTEEVLWKGEGGETWQRGASGDRRSRRSDEKY